MKTKSLLLLAAFVSLFVSCNSDFEENSKIPIKELKSEYVTLNSGVIVEKKGDIYFIADDVMISDEQLKRLDETGSIFINPEDIEINKPKDFIPIDPTSGILEYYDSENSRAVGRHPYQNMFWAMCRYSLKHISSINERNNIKSAMRYIESQTNVRFFDATEEPEDNRPYGFVYPCIMFKRSHGSTSSSYIGRIGGQQDLILSTAVLSPLFGETDYTRGIIVHELLHALGMYHEQSRWDRDNYINVLYGNIIGGTSNINYRKETSNYYTVGNFDFNSIMLYASRGQEPITPNLPTMTKKNGDEWRNNNYLSENDRRFLNTFYLPYIARKDICTELDIVVYDSNNNRLTEDERIELERRLNINRCSYPLRN
ncbi:MAG: M12 family metallopeptidase [Tannerellaceae bacterium]